MMLTKITSLIKIRQNEIFLGVYLILVSIIGYNIGQALTINKAAIQNEQKTTAEQGSVIQPSIKTTQAPRDMRVVASKNSSSKLYHFTWCSGAKRIKEANKVWFPNESAAIAAGYTLAGNCQK